jgi:hypothetical protein
MQAQQNHKSTNKHIQRMADRSYIDLSLQYNANRSYYYKALCWSRTVKGTSCYETISVVVVALIPVEWPIPHRMPNPIARHDELIKINKKISYTVDET